MKLNIILSSLIVLLLTGCVVRLRDSGEASFGWETRFVVKHVATGSGQDSESSIDGKPLVEHIIDLRENDEDVPDLESILILEPSLPEEPIE